MNRSKLSLALLAAAIAAIGFWLWSSRGAERSDPAAPRPVAEAAESRAEIEPLPAAKGVEEPRQDAGGSEVNHESTSKSNSAPYDFTVRGHVYARGTRAPIEDAAVSLCELIGERASFAQAATDQSGEFEILLVGGAPREFGLCVTHEQFSPAWLDSLRSDAGDIELDLELDTHFFIGVDVWAPGAREPVPGADLRLSSTNPAFAEEWLQATSDDRGHAEFEVVGLPRTGLELIVSADRCAPWLMRDLKLEPGAQRRNLICNLEELRRVHGRVIDAHTKLPVASAHVEVLPDRTIADESGGEALSDANGRFEVCLEDCPVEAACLYVSADGLRAARVDRLETFSHANAPELVVELTAPVHLRGRLRARDGQPLRQASVQVAPDGVSTDSEDYGEVGEDGTFELRLEHVPPGPATMICDAEECLGKSLELLALDSMQPIEVTLERALRVHGRVMRASDSKPIPNVRVRLISAASESRWTFSNDDGMFEFRVSPKDVAGARLMVELGGRRLAVSELSAANNQLELEHDISVAVVAPSKAR